MVDEVAAVVAEALRPEPDREFVGRPAEVADEDLLLRKAGVEKCLEVAEILHPLGQRVAHNHDVVVRLEFEPTRLRRDGRRGRQPQGPEDPHTQTPAARTLEHTA